MAWGTRIDLTCSYSAEGYVTDPGTAYSLVAIARDGTVQQLATWMALPDSEISITGSTSMSRREIATLEIRTMSGQAILRLST